MNVKTTFFICMAMLFAFSLDAQKLGDKKTVLEYINLPSKPFPKDYTTYTLTLKGREKDFHDIGLTPHAHSQAMLKLEGYKKVDEGGHFNIELKVEKIALVSTDTRSEEKKKDDRTYKNYFKDYTIAVPVSYKVTDMNGMVVHEGIASPSSQKYSFGGSGYTSLTTLNKAWNERKKDLILNGKKKMYNAALAGFVNDIKTNLDFMRRKETIYFRTIKKHDEESKFEKYMEKGVSEFAKIKYEGSTDAVAESMAPAMEYWESISKKYKANDKKERKIVFAAVMNLATAYIWLDQPDKALPYLEKAKSMDFKNFQVNILMESAKIAKAQMDANQMDNRHAMPDLSSAASPDSGFKGGFLDLYAPSTTNNEPAVEPYFESGYMVDYKGNRHEGKFVFPGGAIEKSRFGTYGSNCIYFLYEVNGKEKKSYLSYLSVKEIGFDDRIYELKKVAVGSDIVGKATMVCRVYDFDKMLVKYCIPYIENREDLETDRVTLLERKSDGMEFNTGSVRFVLKFRKNMMEQVYSDCPSIMKALEERKYTNNLDDHLEYAEQYSKGDCK